ncbi:uncharacterized protein LOC141674939 [Apium graveolens]|uniref:uncharacterized protein LOC141674939 n=1 Tax=Apium graveolens TaxID=4045 RepID=UPI003D78E457
MYYDFFNIDNQQNATDNVVQQSAWIDNYYALANQQRAEANVVEESVHHIDYAAPENQLVVAASEGEQQVPDIEYTALENPLNAASNAVEQSAGNIDYNALEIHSQNIDYYALENHQLSDAANVVQDNAPENHQLSDAANVVQDNATENHQLSAAANVVQDNAPGNHHLSAAANVVQDNAPGNHHLSAAANVGDQLVLEIDYIALANRLKAAADVFEQSVGRSIDYSALQHHLWNLVYYDPENHRLGVAANMVQQSMQTTDHSAPVNQPSGAGAANVSDTQIREVDYITVANELRAAANALEQSVTDLENLPSEQSGFDSRLMEENGEMGINIYQDGLVLEIRYVTNQNVGQNDGHSDHDDEFEHIPDDDPPFDEQPASRSVVRNLASVTFTQESVERGTLACAVCLNEFNVGEMAKQLPCSHFFHEDCIISWLDLRNTCPVCRYQLPTIDDSDDEREEN